MENPKNKNKVINENAALQFLKGGIIKFVLIVVVTGRHPKKRCYANDRNEVQMLNTCRHDAVFSCFLSRIVWGDMLKSRLFRL
jgi:hypothetical protein